MAGIALSTSLFYAASFFVMGTACTFCCNVQRRIQRICLRILGSHLSHFPVSCSLLTYADDGFALLPGRKKSLYVRNSGVLMPERRQAISAADMEIVRHMTATIAIAAG